MLTVFCLTASAQKAERDYIRRGNRSFRDSLFVDADVNYRKALDVNPKSAIAMFNLGNALLGQNKPQEALEQYANAANLEQDKEALAQIYHNIGVIFHEQKDYAKAIEAYKQSLRNNPNVDETRYNLALAQKQLNDQQQNQQNQDQQDQNQDQQQQDQQQQDQQQQQQQDNQMSQENAEQMLNAVMQDEKDVQDKVKQKMQVAGGQKLEKDW